MFAFPSFNTEKDVIAYKSFMLADRMEAQWSQNSQNVLLLMVSIYLFYTTAISLVIFTNFLFWRQLTYSIFALLQLHELFSQGYPIGNMYVDRLIEGIHQFLRSTAEISSICLIYDFLKPLKI